MFKKYLSKIIAKRQNFEILFQGLLIAFPS